MDRNRVLWLLKTILRRVRMSEIREALVDTINKVKDGELPLDTAEQIHLTAHRHVMDRYADDREAKRIGEAAHLERLQKVTQRIEERWPKKK